MEFIKDNKVVVGVAAGAVVAGIAAYFLLKEEAVVDEVKEEQNDQQVSVKPTTAQPNAQQNSEEFQNLIQKIPIKRDSESSNCIDFQTIAEILKTSVELAEEEFIQLTKDQRQARRNAQGVEYEDILIQQCDEIDNLLNKVQERIISALGISQEDFEASLMLIIERRLYNQLLILDMTIKQQLKSKLQSKFSQDIEKAKEIIRYQNTVIKNEPQYFQSILQKVAASPDIQPKLPVIINTMLCDKVYQQYEVEEEDIVRLLGEESQTNQDILSLLQEAQEGMRQLLEGVFPQMQQQQF